MPVRRSRGATLSACGRLAGVAVVLCPSPLTRAIAWGALGERLVRFGHEVVIADPTDDDDPPYAIRWIAGCAGVADVTGRLALVGHSGAGPLLPRLGAALRARGRTVAAYVFLDASLPRERPGNRLDLLAVEDDAFAAQLRDQLAAGGRFPAWSDADLAGEVTDPESRRALLAGLRPRGKAFFDEPLPTAGDGEPGGWPDAPVGYLLTSPAYERVARIAASRGWPVVEHPGGHFAALADPDGTAAALDRLLSALHAP